MVKLDYGISDIRKTTVSRLFSDEIIIVISLLELRREVGHLGFGVVVSDCKV